MDTLEEVVGLVRRKTGVDDVAEDSDIEAELGCYGDDFFELLSEYSNKFNVDMSGCLWYFHTGEEGLGSIGGAFFRPPNERVTRIPVTPDMLADFARKGKWDIDYPEHQIPTRRYDLLINGVLALLALVALVYLILSKVFKAL